ncbi:MAG: response regulator [Planctomycetia bacterium]|nr:response regulator [Planctomycetia bacterium]
MFAPTHSPAVTPPPRASTRPRVLLVDDEPMIRSLARFILERAGYAVEEANTAATAVRRATELPFDVVLLDLSLPDRRGTTVVPEMRRLAPQTRIVLTSGRSEADVPNHGADAFLPKPFACEELLTSLGATVS